MRTVGIARQTTAVLVAALLSPAALTAGPAEAGPGLQVLRLSGPQFAVSDRYATAADVALVTYGGGADVVLLARGDAFADALTGGFLAGAVDAPLLLTAPGVVPGATREALEELEPSTIVLLGGPGAVSPGVEAELGQLADVVRVSGDDRYETAAAITRAGADPGDLPLVDGLRTVLLANGQDFPDALAGGAVSAGSGAPLLLTTPGALPASTAAVLDEYDVEQVVVLGGTGAVSEAVEADVERRTGHPVVRLSGQDRYATAAAIADYAWDELGFDDAQVGLARGDGFADGLAGAARSGALGGPVLLTPPQGLAPATQASLADRCTTLAALEVYGGPAAVSQEAVEQARGAGSTCQVLTAELAVDSPAVTRVVSFTADDDIAGRPPLAADDTTVTLRGLVPGEEYRVDVVDASQVTLARGREPVFLDPDGDGLVRATSGAAVVSRVGDALPQDDAGAGSPAPASSSAVVVPRSESSITVTLDARAAGAYVVVAHPNGGPGRTRAAGGGSPWLEVAQDGTAAGPVAVTIPVDVHVRTAALRYGGPARIDVDPSFLVPPFDQFGIQVTDLTAGAEYRLLLVDDANVDLTGERPVFRREPGTDRADVGTVAAVPREPQDNEGRGTPLEPTSGRGGVVLVGSTTSGKILYDADQGVGYTALGVGRFRAVLIRNGGGDSGGSPEAGGLHPWLELAPDGTALEPVLVGSVVEMFDEAGPHVRAASSVRGSDRVTLALNEVQCAQVDADGRDFELRYTPDSGAATTTIDASGFDASCDGTRVVLSLQGRSLPTAGTTRVHASPRNDLTDVHGNAFHDVSTAVELRGA